MKDQLGVDSINTQSDFKSFLIEDRIIWEVSEEKLQFGVDKLESFILNQQSLSSNSNFLLCLVLAYELSSWKTLNGTTALDTASRNRHKTMTVLLQFWTESNNHTINETFSLYTIINLNNISSLSDQEWTSIIECAPTRQVPEEKLPEGIKKLECLINLSKIDSTSRLHLIYAYELSLWKTQKGITLLHYASYHNQTEIIELLIFWKADVNVKLDNGKTPLHLAAEKGHADIADLLISKGADISCKDTNSWTPLDYAIYYGQHAIVDLLISKGADINCKDTNSWTPLHIAAYFAQHATVKLLISKGADINAKTNSGTTPLHFAAKTGHVEIADLLISKRADINCKDTDSWTPLHMAADFGQNDMVDLLIAKRANVNCVTANGETPLLLAITTYNYSIVQILIDAKANLNIKLEDGLSLLCMSIDKKLAKIFDMLIKAGADPNLVEYQEILPAPIKRKNRTKSLITHGNNPSQNISLIESTSQKKNESIKKPSSSNYIVNSCTIPYASNITQPKATLCDDRKRRI